MRRCLAVIAVVCAAQLAAFPADSAHVAEREVVRLEAEADPGTVQVTAADADPDQEQTAANSSPVGMENDPNGEPPGSKAVDKPPQIMPGSHTPAVALSPEEQAAEAACGSSTGCAGKTTEEEPTDAANNKNVQGLNRETGANDGGALPSSDPNWKPGQENHKDGPKVEPFTDPVQDRPMPNDDSATTMSNADDTASEGWKDPSEASKDPGLKTAKSGKQSGENYNDVTQPAYDPGSGGSNPRPVQKEINSMIAASNGEMNAYRDPIKMVAEQKRKERLAQEDAETEAATSALLTAAPETSTKEDNPSVAKEGDEVRRKTGGWFSDEGTQMYIPQGDPRIAKQLQKLQDKRDAVDLQPESDAKKKALDDIENDIMALSVIQPKEGKVRGHKSVWLAKFHERKAEEDAKAKLQEPKPDKVEPVLQTKAQILQQKKERVLAQPDGSAKMRALAKIEVEERLAAESGDVEAEKPVDTDPYKKVECDRKKLKADGMEGQRDADGNPVPDVELGEDAGCYKRPTK